MLINLFKDHFLKKTLLLSSILIVHVEKNQQKLHTRYEVSDLLGDWPLLEISTLHSLKLIFLDIFMGGGVNIIIPIHVRDLRLNILLSLLSKILPLLLPVSPCAKNPQPAYATYRGRQICRSPMQQRETDNKDIHNF